MGELNKLLRLLVQGDKEGKITAVTAMPTATKFTSQLTSGQTRKALAVYNHSDTASGDCYYSYSSSADISGESMVIPKGALVDVPVANDIDVYFFTASGEMGNLRVEELA
ncbi:hypothetical protein LCGC14_2504510 [marine sediment metagenome]|uniref:Uncharacterized protein n=1 Tax=marine sediment metagenome TaxID=412755 RepID=A0A0F9B0W1_9ZZZZ